MRGIKADRPPRIIIPEACLRHAAPLRRGGLVRSAQCFDIFWVRLDKVPVSTDGSPPRASAMRGFATDWPKSSERQMLQIIRPML